TGKDGDERATEAEAHQLVDYFVDRCTGHQLGQGQVVTGHAQQAETNHQHAGDGAPLEGNIESFLDAAFCGLCGADIGPYRHEHADEAGQPGKKRADGEADSGFCSKCCEKSDKHNSADNGDNCVLALHVGACPLLNGCGNLFHTVISLRQCKNPVCRDDSVGNSCCGADQSKVDSVLFHIDNPPLFSAFNKAYKQKRIIVNGIMPSCQYVNGLNFLF